MQAAERTVLFVLSSSHSGSTWLALLLGSHSQACYIGELLQMFRPERPRTCSLCDERGTACPLFHDLAERTPQHIHRLLFERTDKRFLIDSSKRLSWAREHLAEEGLAKKYIHLIRDPRGVTLSWSLRGRTTQLDHWVRKNREFGEFIRSNGLDSRLVLYNELAEQREETLRELCQWLRLAYQPSQREYWRFEHHGWGRSGATSTFLRSAVPSEDAFYAEMGQRDFHDLRWRDQLDAARQEAIVQDPGVQKLLAELDLRFTDSGLERASERVVRAARP